MTTRLQRIEFSEGWFMPAYWHFAIRYLLFMGYFIAQAVLLAEAGDALKKIETRPERNWKIILIASQAVLFTGPFLSLLLFKEYAFPLSLFSVLVSLIQAYYLFYHPYVLYGWSLPRTIKSQDVHGTFQVEDTPSSTALLSPELLEQIDSKVDVLMQKHKPFLQPGYDLRSLSQDTGICMHKLSAYISSRHSMKFYDWLNQHRISYCLQKLETLQPSLVTLEDLTEESGFRDRSSFIHSFEEVTGQSPSEYLGK